MANIRVIVADDHEVARTLVAQTLESIGFEVVGVADGQAAVESALERLPELMLIDVNMPGSNGFDVVRRIKGTPELAHIPVVMLTASGASQDVAQALELGAADYLTKPFSPAELLARVSRLAREIQAAADIRLSRAG
jgi:two-component system phosphate regulon response regulator PhoB